MSIKMLALRILEMYIHQPYQPQKASVHPPASPQAPRRGRHPGVGVQEELGALPGTILALERVHASPARWWTGSSKGCEIGRPTGGSHHGAADGFGHGSEDHSLGGHQLATVQCGMSNGAVSGQLFDECSL